MLEPTKLTFCLLYMGFLGNLSLIYHLIMEIEDLIFVPGQPYPTVNIEGSILLYIGSLDTHSLTYDLSTAILCLK